LNPEFALSITGHTDNAGTSEYNMDLSVKRAEAVKRALVSLGVDPKRIQAIGRGETMPYVPNDTEENRTRNRRIELELIKN
jgi:outer membrane protein OmpA-like peptidoglycan-associated protein